MVFQEALLSVPRDHHARPPSPPPPPPSTSDNVADALGDESNALYSQEWRWATTNARGIMTACIAHALGDLDAMAEYVIPRNATYHTRLGSVCVAHVIEDLRDTLDRNGNVSWAHISTPGGYVTAQWQTCISGLQLLGLWHGLLHSSTVPAPCRLLPTLHHHPDLVRQVCMLPHDTPTLSYYSLLFYAVYCS